MKAKFHIAVVPFMFALGAPPAHALSVALSEVLGVQWTLRDLDPLDGIAPTLSLFNMESLASVHVAPSGTDPYTIDRQDRTPSLTAVGVLSPTPSWFPSQLWATYSGPIGGELRSFSGVNFIDGVAFAVARVKFEFMLSPHTEIVFTADLHARGSSGGPPFGNANQYFCSIATAAYQGISVSDTQLDVVGNCKTPMEPGNELVEFDESMQSEMRFINGNNSLLHAAAQWQTETIAVNSGGGIVTPIPEPPTLALVVLGLLPWMRTRRSTKSPSAA